MATASSSSGPLPPLAISSSSASPPSSSRTRRRLSATSRFLNRIFCHLIPPFPQSSLQRSQSEGPRPALADPSESSRDAVPSGPGSRRRRSSQDDMVPNSFTSPRAPPIVNKENQRPDKHHINGTAGSTVSKENRSGQPPKPPILVALPLRPRSSNSETPVHQVFMDQALDMARLALRTNETPVGCVLVHHGKVIARGMNATNVTRNGTRHAEFMAISALLSFRPEGVVADNPVAEPRHVPTEMSAAAAAEREREKDAELGPDPSLNDPTWVKRGHLYPYGQKISQQPRVHRSIIRECVLYVTVEPCVMCAGLLRQLGIQKVYFGAVNDKFGGAGGVFSIHMNSIRPQDKQAGAAPAVNNASNTSLARSSSTQSGHGRIQAGPYHIAQSNPDGDGGNVEHGFEIEGGWGRDEAVGLLRRFYVQENGRAPQPRKKEGRAARLAAIESGAVDADGNLLVTSGTPDQTGNGETTEGSEKKSTTGAELPVQTPTLAGGPNGETGPTAPPAPV